MVIPTVHPRQPSCIEIDISPTSRNVVVWIGTSNRNSRAGADVRNRQPILNPRPYAHCGTRLLAESEMINRASRLAKIRLHHRHPAVLVITVCARTWRRCCGSDLRGVGGACTPRSRPVHVLVRECKTQHRFRQFPTGWTARNSRHSWRTISTCTRENQNHRRYFLCCV